MANDQYYDSNPRSTTENQDDISKAGSSARDNIATSQTVNSTTNDSPQLPFGLESASEPKDLVPAEQLSRQIPANFRSKLLSEGQSTSREEGSRSQSLEPATLERKCSLERKIHHYNPYLNEHIGRGTGGELPSTEAELQSEAYQVSDFTPIDITKYQTKRPFALSAFSIICQIIEQDINHGSSMSQLSAQLLSHVHPFFFHQTTRLGPTCTFDSQSIASTLADNLMNPALSTRLIEGIFISHIEHLRRLKLYAPAAELCKLCSEEFPYPGVAGQNINNQGAAPAGDTLKVDPLEIKATCSSCRSPLSMQATACRNCSQRREPCPICELPISPLDKVDTFTSALHAYCHACGHSAHVSCMSTWLSLPDTHGECPTPFCGCDCGPGVVRQQRIIRQIQAREGDAAIRVSSTSGLKKDPVRVGTSPAVDRARDSLRKGWSGGGERGTQSGDEGRGKVGSAWSKKGSNLGATRGLEGSNSGNGAGPASETGSSFGRRVRVVEPDK